MSELDRLLLRILKRAGVPDPSTLPSPEQWADLLERFSRVFSDAEQDRYILERSLSTMSRELEELTEQRTRFLLNTSYQLRNPLTVLLSAIQLRLGDRGRSDMDWPTFLEALDISGRRILRQLGTLLDFAQIDLGYLQLRRARGNPRRVIMGLIKSAGPLIQKKGLTVSTEGLDDLPEMMVDPGKLETVLGYLLSNSLNASPHEGAVIISAETEGADIVIEYRDFRPVLDSAQIRAMFERYSEDIENVNWSGVSHEDNLALAAELAALQGGSLTAEALPEGKMAFRFRFPYVPIEASSVALPEPDIARGNVAFNLEGSSLIAGDARALNDDLDIANAAVEMVRNRNRPAILYVEPDAAVRESVRRILASRYDIFFARDGESALSMIDQFNPDLILCETLLSRKGGFDVLAALKSQVRWRAILFIFLTGDSTLTSKLKGLEMGADDYLLKPFLEAELLARIHSVLRLRHELSAVRRNLDRAALIQQELLPASPQRFSHFDFEAFYRPVEELSGDFYDLEVGKDWTYFYLADVTGHGAAPAQVTYLLKEIFQSESKNEDPELSALLGRIAQRYSRSDTGLDIAFLLLRLSNDGKNLQFIRAGSPGPIHISQKRMAFLNPPSGPPLSRRVGDLSQYVVNDVALHDTSVLYFFSDGLTEFGTSRKRVAPREVLKILARLSPQSWALELTALLSETVGDSETDDDLTVVRFRITAPRP